MERPKAEKPYTFVRSRAGEIESTTFVRYSDGSAGFVADGFFHVHEGGPDVWQNALAELATLGFEEIGAAKARGILPVDWNPPQAKDSAI